MQTDKLNFFDLFAFFIPGGTLLYFWYFLLKPIFPLASFLPSTDATLILVPYICASYFTGHALSSLIAKWFGQRVEKKNAWLSFLDENRHLVERLNKLSISELGESFLAENGIDKNPMKVKFFYDYLHSQRIDIHRDSTEHILYAQMVFFRNVNALLIACIASTLLSIAYRSWFLEWSVQKHWVLTMGLLLALYTSIVVMRDRQRVMIGSIYRSYLTAKTLDYEKEKLKK